MMIDEELLEYAAKAMGWFDYPEDSEEQGDYWHTDKVKAPFDKRFLKVDWNPLTSDADAFRLMVHLCLVVFPPDDDDPAAVVQGVGPVFHSLHITEVSECGDYRATTRRAIVRAAAEIGKCMTEEECER